MFAVTAVAVNSYSYHAHFIMVGPHRRAACVPPASCAGAFPGFGICFDVLSRAARPESVVLSCLLFLVTKEICFCATNLYRRVPAGSVPTIDIAVGGKRKQP